MKNIDNHIWINFSGQSMMPVLQPGDQLLIKLITPNTAFSFKLGQIVFYRDDKEWIVHRIIDNESNELKLKGDIGLGRDTVGVSRVVGIVIGRRDQRGEVDCWPQGLHSMARNLALASREICHEQHRLLRWPFYAQMRIMQSLAIFHRFVEAALHLR